MKVLSKMDSDVTYMFSKADGILLPKLQITEVDGKLANHPLFKLHLENGGVEILGDQCEAIEEEKQDAEALRQELLKKCKDKGIKVNPNTGIKKLKEKLGE